MKTFNEWNESNDFNQTTAISINDLIEKIDRLSPNFSELQIFSKDINKIIQEARMHFDQAVNTLKKVAYTKDEQGNYLGDKEFNNPAS